MIIALSFTILNHITGALAEPVQESENAQPADVQSQEALGIEVLNAVKAIVPKESNELRKKTPDFTLETRKAYGLFVVGTKVIVTADISATPLTLTIRLPSSEKNSESAKLIQNTANLLNGNKERSAVLNSNFMLKRRKKTIIANLETAILNLSDIGEKIKTLDAYVSRAGHSTVPRTFSRFCEQQVTFKIQSQLQRLYDQVYSFDDTPPDERRHKRATTQASVEPERTPLTKAEVTQISGEMLEQTLVILERVHQVDTELKRMLSIMEALSNSRVNEDVRLIIQANKCVATGASETTVLKECLTIGKEYVCSIQTMQTGRRDEGYLMIPVIYPTFVSGLHEQYVQRIENPGQYTSVSNCTVSHNRFRCPNLEWSTVKCFTNDLGDRDTNQLIQHCNITRPSRQSYRSQEVQQGILVDNIDDSTSTIIEGQYLTNYSSVIVPFTMSFIITSPRTNRLEVKSRRKFVLGPILTSWFGTQDVEALTKAANRGQEADWYDFLDNYVYKIVTFLTQIITTPILIKTLWTVYKSKVKDRYSKWKRGLKERKKIEKQVSFLLHQNQSNMHESQRSDKRSRKTKVPDYDEIMTSNL